MFANVTDELLDQIVRSLELPTNISKRKVADKLRQICWAYLTWIYSSPRQMHTGFQQRYFYEPFAYF